MSGTSSSRSGVRAPRRRHLTQVAQHFAAQEQAREAAFEHATTTLMNEFLWFADHCTFWDRYLALQPKPVIPTTVIDWASIDATPLPDWSGRIRKLLRQGRLEQSMMISKSSYEVLTQEFLSTLVVRIHDDRIDPEVITFHLAGLSQHMSFDDFSITCGFYDAVGRHEDWFLAQSFRYTIVPHNDNHGHVGSRDLFLLCLMLDSTPVHLGYLVAHAFHLQETKGASRLVGGAYITRVARHLGLLEQFHDLDEEAELDAMFGDVDDAEDAQPAATQSDDLSLAAAVPQMMLDHCQFFEETRLQQREFRDEIRGRQRRVKERVHWLQRREFDRYGGEPPHNFPPE
ncbi:hypothetical protein LINGRAHAP2_LOCUS23021 [Linum grandiflorum]